MFTTNRSVRGGSWNFEDGLDAPRRGSPNPTFEFAYVGIRVASLVPEPGSMVLVMTGLAGRVPRQKRS